MVQRMESIFICIMVLALLSFSNSLPTVLKLERAGEQRTRSGVVNFTLEGSLDLFRYGFYFTKVKIGTPLREYRFLIDTGSELSWLPCLGCDRCPTSTNRARGMQHLPYSPYSSSSASVISCSDKRCPGHHRDCNSLKQGCTFDIRYVDERVITGFYVSDVFHLDTLMDGSRSTHFSTPLTFGCSKNRSVIVNPEVTVDGILGLNARNLSLTSQLSSPRFSHCLGGGETGGGVLVFGEVVDPRIVYTPLDLSQGSYNVRLQSISLSGEVVHIDPIVFESNNGGAVVDSGTTLIVLEERAYDPVINSLTNVVSTFARPVKVQEYHCFEVSNRSVYKFPNVNFNLDGGSMTIQQKEYLMWIRYLDGTGGVWCLLFRKHAHQTILGDIILQNKIIEYDLAAQRLGWVNHDCTKPFNVSSDMSSSSSILDVLLIPKVTGILTLFLYLSMVG